MKKLAILLTMMIGLLALTISSVSAQQCATTGVEANVTFTEDQINSTFWVTNPVDRNLSNLTVDLQSANGGQAVLSADYSYRTTAGDQTANVVVTIVPTVDNGRVDWSITDMTVNDQPAPSDLIDQVNQHIGASWHRWISEHAPQGLITAVAITDSDITYTYQPWEAGCVIATEEPASTDDAPITLPIAINTADHTITITEADINNSFGVTNPINRNTSNMSVDLQSANGGQVVVNFDYTYRTLRGTSTTATVAVIFVPSIVNSRIEWNVTSMTVNGQPAAADLVAQINNFIAASWARWISEKAPSGKVTSVTISDSDVTIAYTP